MQLVLLKMNHTSIAGNVKFYIIGFKLFIIIENTISPLDASLKSPQQKPTNYTKHLKFCTSVKKTEQMEKDL